MIFPRSLLQYKWGALYTLKVPDPEFHSGLSFTVTIKYGSLSLDVRSSQVFDRNTFVGYAIDSGPLILTTAIAPMALGVARSQW
jgi:hypothetical protein